MSPVGIPLNLAGLGWDMDSAYTLGQIMSGEPTPSGEERRAGMRRGDYKR